jgi:surfeit locus 1 family protein
MTKPILSASISTAIALAILCALGTWQLQRRAWKNALLADIDRAEQSPAVPLGAGIPPRRQAAR